MIKMIKKIDKFLSDNYKIMAIITGVLSIIVLIMGVVNIANGR
jgi:hypothetical protein